MSRSRSISLIAFILIVVGVIGSIYTFKKGDNHMETIEEKVDAKDMTNIDIETDNSKIEVLPTDEDDIHIQLSAKNPEDLLSSEIIESTLVIKVKDKRTKWFNFGILPTGPSLKVYIPEKV